MADNARGLYEALITEALEARLRDLDGGLEAIRARLHTAEAADRIAFHLSGVVRRAVDDLSDKSRVEEGIALARRIIDVIDESIKNAQALPDRPIEPGSILHAIVARLPDGRPETIRRPLIPLQDTTLLTNSPDEPRVGHQLHAEVESADRIDVVMAFIRRSGIAPMLDVLRSHCDGGRSLRVLTTTYTGSTEERALNELRGIGAQIRISYDTTTTRLHAKAWLFHRRSGCSTAYIGSSNLTHSALVTGLEWNVRVSGTRNPDVIDKVDAVFETYWNGGDFVPYDRDEFRQRTEATTSGPAVMMSPVELRPEPFQERLLEQIALSREQGHHRNLLVAATGTGKTVVAVLDYAELRTRLPRARLLFVAHREEILSQSCALFRHGLRDGTFGEMWVAGTRPNRFDHVFASIQSLAANGMADLDPAHFDVVIVDEFHHAAAASYEALLDHVRPKELLGLTATPERSDGLPILQWFDNRIAAELRLWDAIDRHYLSPFAYYGIHDDLPLHEVVWRRGSGYDVEGLSNLFTASDSWARLVLKNLDERVDDVHAMRALGFCVSVDHARYMARVFAEANVPSVAIWADTPEEQRKAALSDLVARRVNAVFSVDLFNEGIDVPDVDTLLLLRPTESPTLFLQQLGRGLRKSRGKTVCTVLDFVGQHRREFRFDRRFGALLGGSRKDLIASVEDGFPVLPAGCHMELDPVAMGIVLRSIREAVPSQWTAKVSELRSMGRPGHMVTLSEYLAASELDLDDVYSGTRTWSDLCGDAGQELRVPGPEEPALRRSVGRLLHIDDIQRIATYRRFLTAAVAPELETLSLRDRRLLRMLVASAVDQVADTTTSLAEGLAMLWAHPQVRAEIVELVDVLAPRIGHLQHSLESHAEVPLQVHARYTRIEIFSAFGIGVGATAPAWQTGVHWAQEAKADLFAFTLDKSVGHFSPTTRYRDYAVSRDLIHWESQRATRADSQTGRRYQEHVARGTSVMLFARLRQSDRAFWFLGPATYVSHEGEQPMAVTWRLKHPLPGDLFASFAAAVA